MRRTNEIFNHEYLKRQRIALGMTQQAVADAVGIHIRQYQRLESGEKSMSSVSLRIGLAICDVLKLNPHCFVPPIPGMRDAE